MVQGEDGHAGRDQSHNGVFVQWVSLAENGQMQEHDRQQFAGFGEDVGDVVDVCE